MIHMILAVLFNAFFMKGLVKEIIPINLAISFRSPTILEMLTSVYSTSLPVAKMISGQKIETSYIII